MHADDADRIRASWARLAPHADAVADDFYARLFATAPDAAALFAHVDMAVQRQKFLRMVGDLVRVLDDPGELVSESVPSGRRHASYGARDEHWALVGRALLDAMAHALGDDFDRATRAAWQELYTLVSAVMQRAASRARPARV
ncbi:globin domain-containing protein [Roseisolibacter sp. H3M3-2]|uniref:globin domain-containing protein n=1 Tax=Roseisolibacter sp. H3M3-2 TaxID=3031323 RepID=UPI0023DAE15E|nr:globin domain-containing protein [Roseisolibacter sp. H3M3-2]MDF1503062.1 globin domain-containing protein [Roseisolibacter sp. H3M3-2]